MSRPQKYAPPDDYDGSNVWDEASYRERCERLRRLIDRRRREVAFEADADRFIRSSVGGRRAVSRDRLLKQTRRAELTDAQIDAALERLHVVTDGRGHLRFPAELQGEREKVQ